MDLVQQLMEAQKLRGPFPLRLFGNDLEVYTYPATMSDADTILAAIAEDKMGTVIVETLARRVRDKDGKKLFKSMDRKLLEEQLPCSMRLFNQCIRINSDMGTTEEETTKELGEGSAVTAN